MPKEDISTRKDIEQLVDTFYKKVIQDNAIGSFFTEVVKLDWNKHILVMSDFWESMLLQNNVYHGNPMKTHIDLNQKSPPQEKHFNQWLTIFTETVDELFSGGKAELAKTRALSIATVIRAKLMTQ